MKKAPEEFRLQKHPLLSSDSSYGNNGFFIFPHPRIDKYSINCQVSDGLGWEHVSVTISSSIRKVDRCPTWGEMCWVKAQFWTGEEAVMQLHPPEGGYVNQHHLCLHLWRPTGVAIPLPDSLMVGLKQKV